MPFFSSEQTSGTKSSLQFSKCYSNGRLAKVLNSLPDLPCELEELMSGNSAECKQFRNDICAYNSVLAFTSISVEINEHSGGFYSYRIHGELHRHIGSLAPLSGEPLKFAQFYVIDAQNELLNRHNVMPSLVKLF